MNENWEKDEYKALEEFCKLEIITYEVIAASFFSKQVAIKFKGLGKGFKLGSSEIGKEGTRSSPG